MKSLKMSPKQHRSCGSWISLVAGLLLLSATLPAFANQPDSVRIFEDLSLGAKFGEFRNLEPVKTDGAIQIYRSAETTPTLGFLRLQSLELGFHAGLLVSGAFACAKVEDGQRLESALEVIHGRPVTRNEATTVWVIDDLVLIAEHSDSICRAGFTSSSVTKTLRSEAREDQLRQIEQTLGNM